VGDTNVVPHFETLPPDVQRKFSMQTPMVDKDLGKKPSTTWLFLSRGEKEKIKVKLFQGLSI